MSRLHPWCHTGQECAAAQTQGQLVRWVGPLMNGVDVPTTERPNCTALLQAAQMDDEDAFQTSGIEILFFSFLGRFEILF